MPANPLEDDPVRDQRIRERAYHLWESEGRPHGRGDEFWERARELVAIEENPGAGQIPAPQAAGADPSRPEAVEEAFLQENLGEFPSRLSDQGDVQPTPRAARATRPRPAKASVAPVRGPSLEAPETLPANPALKAKALDIDPPAAPSRRPGKKKG